MNGRPTLLGIVNVTEDSFSDGGRYLERGAALAHARAMAAQGADIIDLGAAASNPDARPVSPELEIERLAPLVEILVRDG
ncbi:MAG TPA: dihydropteroate synthase, partial [Rhizomicrobium sp.]|nr:dihydropteroate synthase [Rhizomicrobium sp.]